MLFVNGHLLKFWLPQITQEILSFPLHFTFHSLWQSSTRVPRPPLPSAASHLLDLISLWYLSSHVPPPVAQSPKGEDKSQDLNKKHKYELQHFTSEWNFKHILEVCLNATLLANPQAFHSKGSDLLGMYSVKQTIQDHSRCGTLPEPPANSCPWKTFRVFHTAKVTYRIPYLFS